MKYVCEIASRLDARRASVRWLDEIASAADAYLGANPKRDGARHLKRAREMGRLARKAIAQGSAKGAAHFALATLQAAWQAEFAEGRVMIDIGVDIYRTTEAVNAERARVAELQRDSWRRKAATIRKRNSRMTKTAIAKKISPERWGTVRRYI